MLRESSWILFGDNGKVNVDTETINDAGFADYILQDKSGFPICILEAKRKSKSPLVGKEKSRQYAQSLRCRFVILSNGFTHYFWDIEQGNPQLIKYFPTQDQLELRKKTFNPPRENEEEIKKDYIARSQFPEFDSSPDYLNESLRDEFLRKNNIRLLRDYQVDAVNEIQNSIIRGNERFLLEMATGTGKTLTSAAIIKMFLRLYEVKRVLFLVDRIELETQAKREFDECLKNDYSTSIWKENKSDWIKSEIVISTVQSFTRKNKYKKLFSPDTFNLVISDEAHRSLGSSSRRVFEYFVGFKLGLTATPKDYLKSVDIEKMEINNPASMDRRLLLDTYNTFGCESGLPTFRYSLKDGVKDGYLVNPKVIDARTEITTQLLSEEGYIIDSSESDSDNETATFYQKDFEKRFFSENTNAIFCETFIKNAMLDPYTGLIGKTLIFCVSQHHAAKITNLLNIYANKLYPNVYKSDFAIQVTSDIDADTQQMTIDFRNNVLSGKEKLNPFYQTSKTRVCVTVGMMTTGYDCSDILNICMMRPIFSPSDFIQMKGRGTRKFDFKQSWILQSKIPFLTEDKFKKNQFFLFDFFGNYEYFEEKFNYDEILILPSESSGSGNPQPTIVDEVVSTIPDPLRDLKETIINESCMRIDRDIYPSFKKKILNNKELQDLISNDQFELAENLVIKDILNSPNNDFSIDKIRRSIGLDRTPTTKELIFYSLNLTDHLPSFRECIDEEFEKLDNKFNIEENVYSDAKEVFEAYVSDPEFREIINNKKYAELSIHPSGAAFKSLPKEYKNEFPLYIKKNINLERLKKC